MKHREDHIRKDVNITYQGHRKFVSVIIPVFNDYERLGACLEALESQSYPRDLFEVIVVDNGSEMDSIIKMEKYPKVIFCVEEEPGSYAARNKGIFISNAALFAFTDSDCIPDKDWISTGVKALGSSENIGLVGGRIDFFFKDPERPSIWERYDSITYLQQQDSIEVCKFSATANMFTTNKVIKHVGLFDTKLKSGGDREWGERVAAAGYKLKFAPQVKVSHPARSTFQEIKKRNTRIYGGSHQLRSRKLYIQRVISLCLNILKDLSPPLRFGYRIVKDPRVPRMKDKVLVTLVHVLVKISRAWTRLRYEMGAKPTRS